MKKMYFRKLFFLFLILVCLLLGLSEVHPHQPLKLRVFYSPGCHACIKLKEDFLPGIEKKYKDLIKIEYFNTREKENYQLLHSVAKGPKRGSVPAILIGEEALVGRREIQRELAGLIDSYLAKERRWFELAFPKIIDIKNCFSSMGFRTILWAGFIDGLNPCAFGVIIFFVSLLTLGGYKKEACIYIGISYIAAVYITYLLIGIGLFKFLYLLENFHLLMKIFYFLLAALCFFLAFLSLSDYFRLTWGNSANGGLRLPAALNNLISRFSACSLSAHNLIRKHFQARDAELNIFGKIRLVIAALFIGFCVSVLECACTGQVYLPTISLCLKMPSLRGRAFLFLVLYNLMFIIPLLLVFILALRGMSSQRFSAFVQSHTRVIRLLLAGLFIFLGTLIVLF